ncbi:MAG: DNA repair exonuclease, partial [Coraliomargarita sp.]|nr:DNA repair exonuclease [Coraliomargarita sp.]
VEFLHIQVDVADIENDDELREILKRTLQDTARNLVSESSVVRLELVGRTCLRWQVLRDQDVWKEVAAQYAREMGTLWLDKVVFDLSDILERGHGATDELAGIMKSIREESGFSEICRKEIEGILQELAPQRRAKLLPDEATMDQLAWRLAEAGAERILAQMKGATP